MDETLRPGDDPFAGSVIAGFQVIKKLGQGAMGMVYLAKQVSLDRYIALKILPPNPAFLQADTISRFMREARTAASLSHVNIVQVHDAGEFEGLYFIAMEYVRGAGLSDVLAGLNRLSEQAALDVVLQTAQGLGAAADRGVIHRDIKPANLMFTEAAVIKVADFGLAKALNQGAAGLTDTGRILGTPSYMSPEQAESQETDHRSDIFSLGVTLFEMVTGTKPFQAETIPGVLRKIVDSPTPDARELRSDLSEATAQIIFRMLEKKPADRYSSYAELVGDVLVAQKSLDRLPGYMDSVKALIKSNLSVLDDAPILPPSPSVGSSAKTIALAPEMPKPDPTPIPASPPSHDSSRSSVVDLARGRSPLTYVMGGAAGVVLLAAAVLAGILYLGQKKEPEISPLPTGTRSYQLEVTSPEKEAVLPAGTVKFEGKFTGKTPDTIRVGTAQGWIEGGVFGAEVELREPGRILVPLEAAGSGGEKERILHPVVVDDKDPVLEFEKRVQGGQLLTSTEEFAVVGRLVDEHPAEVTANGVPQSLRAGRFRFTGRIESEGSREFEFEGRDAAGHTVKSRIEVVRDSTLPDIVIEDLPDQVLSVLPECKFIVSASETLSRLLVNGEDVEPLPEGAARIAAKAKLQPGENTITVVAQDLAGNKKRREGKVVYLDRRTQEGKVEEDHLYQDLLASMEDGSTLDQIEALRRFLKAYPENRHAPEARTRIEGLLREGEREAWRAVIRATSEGLEARIRALTSFLDLFPESESAERAGNDLAFFRRLQGASAEIVTEGKNLVNRRDGAVLARVPQGIYPLSGAHDRRVQLSEFYIYRNEVTAAQFAAFLAAVGSDRDEHGQPMLVLPEGANAPVAPTVGGGVAFSAVAGREDFPAIYVTWFGATAYARWVGGRLPTEAQWEAACNPRGQRDAYFWGKEVNPSYTWFLGNSHDGPKKVGQKFPTLLLGLYDTAGNVWEWCLDAYDPSFPASEEGRADDPVAAGPSPFKSLRGGAWDSPAEQLRLDFRTGAHPRQASATIGFRVVLPPPR